jgi:branched-chain amino acid transport system permease protein
MMLEIWPQALLVGLARGGIYSLLATGITLAYAVSRQIHLTHGSFLAVALYICVFLSRSLGLEPYISVLITAPLFFCMGILLYRFILKRMIAAHIILSFQIFLGLIIIMENLLLIIFTATPTHVPTALVAKRVSMGNMTLGLPQLIAFITATVLGIGLYVILQSTDFGRAVKAVSEDSEAATIMGIKVEKVRMWVWGLVFVLIAAAASLVAPWTEIEPSLGLDFTFFAIIILVIGGMGNFLGALIAGFAMGLLEAVSGLLFGGMTSSMVPYVAFIIILFMRPQGIFRGVG